MAIDTRKILHTAFDKHTKNVDNYNHNGSTWLIFTDEKKWVIELTKEGTLWYNYYFFQNIMKLLSLEVVENQHYITKWVEDTVINGVKSTKGEYYKEIQKVEYTIENGVKYTIDIEDAIQNGVKKTRRNGDSMNTEAEDVIQNGVKDTSNRRLVVSKEIEDTIQNGVKRTLQKNINRIGQVEDAIKNGVRETKLGAPDNRDYFIEDTIQNGLIHTRVSKKVRHFSVEDTIQNGVKETLYVAFHRQAGVEDTIQNGVKYTGDRQGNYNLVVEDTIQNGVKHTRLVKNKNQTFVEDTIQNGVKKTYSDKIPHEYDWSDQFTEEIEGIIQNGVKHTEYGDWLDGDERLNDIIENGVKETTWTALPRHRSVEDTIQNGVKETKMEEHHRLREVVQTVKNGIKETTPGGYLGSVEMKGKTVHQFEHSKQDNDVEDVIESGIKATTTNYWLSEDKNQITEIEDVISNGIKKTEGGILFDESKIDTVISEGIKETIPVVPGDILDTIDFMSYNNTTNVQHLISDVIEKGIKETHDDVIPHTGRVEGVIKNGVKKTVDALSSRLPNPVKDVIKNGVKICIPSRTPLYNPMDFSVQYRENHRLDDVASVLEKGIKEVQPLPSQEGNMDYSNYYYRQGDRTIPHTKYVDDAIRDGVKETWGYEKQPQKRIDEVIMNGQKD